MKFINLFKKKQKKETSDFSDFFLHASDEKKQEVFTEIAKMANKDQQEVYRRAQLKLRSQE